jgi:hypothetical protein
MTNTTSSGKSTRNVLLGMLLVALILAGGVSFYASSQPDGLNKVAADKGFNAGEREHDLAGFPLAGYETAGLDNPRLSKAVAGVLGVGVTLIIGAGIFLLIRRRSPEDSASPEGRAEDVPRR